MFKTYSLGTAVNTTNTHTPIHLLHLLQTHYSSSTYRIHLKRVDDGDPEEQDRLDLAIKRAKMAASGAAGLIIAVGKNLTSD